MRIALLSDVILSTPSSTLCETFLCLTKPSGLVEYKLYVTNVQGVYKHIKVATLKVARYTTFLKILCISKLICVPSYPPYSFIKIKIDTIRLSTQTTPSGKASDMGWYETIYQMTYQSTHPSIYLHICFIYLSSCVHTIYKVFDLHYTL